MFCYAVVGQTGEGKSYYIKNELLPLLIHQQLNGKKPDLFIFDINNEYLKFDNEYKKFLSIKDFLLKIENKKDVVLIFEEAATFLKLSANADSILMNTLVRKRHLNAMIVFIFQSLRQVPIYVFDFVNYLVLFKTNDRINNIATKYKDNPDVLNAFLQVQKIGATKKHYKLIKKLY